MSGLFRLRAEPSLLGRVLAAAACLGIILIIWTVLTWGATPEARIISPSVLPSVGETFRSFESLWFERALTRNVFASLLRVLFGFGLAIVIGVPIGIVCGTWPRINAFFAPLTVFGRNVPISALVPITLLWFGIDEKQKIMFIFLACIAFVIVDTAGAIASVHERYVQSAYTLGASKAQIILKVLVPLALPDIFSSLRLLFGLAFGYIVLAEMVNMTSGLGALILTSQRRGPMEHVYLVLFSITLIAYGIDRMLLSVQHYLFPYRESDG